MIKCTALFSQHYDSGDSHISNPSIPSLTLYERDHCASYVHYLCNYYVMGGKALLFSLDETHEQHIEQSETARTMLGRAFALF